MFSTYHCAVRRSSSSKSLTIMSALYWKCTPSLDITKATVIFLHAAWVSSTMFDETIDHLSQLLPNTNLLCVDLNGHGNTTAGRKTFTLWEQGDDVISLMVHPLPEKTTTRSPFCFKSQANRSLTIGRAQDSKSNSRRHLHGCLHSSSYRHF
jgi:hypothetical protein